MGKLTDGPIVPEGEHWRDRLQQFFPSEVLHDELRPFLSPFYLLAGSIEDCIEDATEQKVHFENFRTASEKLRNSYLTLDPALKRAAGGEMIRLLQQLEYELRGNDPKWALFQDDKPRPWPGKEGAIAKMQNAIDTQSLSHQAASHEARQKIRLVSVAREIWIGLNDQRPTALQLKDALEKELRSEQRKLVSGSDNPSVNETLRRIDEISYKIARNEAELKKLGPLSKKQLRKPSEPSLNKGSKFGGFVQELIFFAGKSWSAGSALAAYEKNKG
ncbi:MAG: hypothetical protein JXR14_02490 [Paracoccaceae bacterium]